MNEKIPKTPVKFLLYISKPYKMLAFFALLAVVVAQVAELLAIYVISGLVDNFSQATDKAAQMDVLVYWGMLFLVLGVIDRAGWRLSGFIGLRWIIQADAFAYKKLYSYITKHSHSYYTNRFAGALSNKISNAAGGSGEMLFRFMWDILPEVISIVVTLYLFFSLH